MVFGSCHFLFHQFTQGEQCPNPDLRQFLHRLVGNTSKTQESHFV